MCNWKKIKYFVSKCDQIEFCDAVPDNEGVLFEGMTSISAIMHGIDQGFNNRSILQVYFDRERIEKKEKEIAFLVANAPKYGYTLYLTTKEALETVSKGTTHGGIVAVCSERTLPSLTENSVDTSLPFGSDSGFFVMLEGIEDPYNFGYTMRSLYAAGVDGVILSPRNWMEVAGIVAKSAAGASEQLPIAIAAASDAMTFFRERGYHIACAGIRNAVSMYDASLKKPLLLVVGGEKRGISSAALQLADTVVKIDYGREFRGSLSAASAATVLAFEVLRQNRS